MILYHASPNPDLNKIGIRRFSNPTCGNRKDPCIFLGSLEYLEEQYFQYCPKGIYYIFEVNISEDNVQYLSKVNHYKTYEDIKPEYVSPFSIKVVK